MAQAIELATYRHIVLGMIEQMTGLRPVTDADGVPADEDIEFTIRRYRACKESARNCANAIIASEG